jgi:hypothetical protein
MRVKMRKAEKLRISFALAASMAAPVALYGQSLDPADTLHPKPDTHLFGRLHGSPVQPGCPPSAWGMGITIGKKYYYPRNLTVSLSVPTSTVEQL